MIRGVPPHFLESHGLVSGISSDKKEWRWPWIGPWWVPRVGGDMVWADDWADVFRARFDVASRRQPQPGRSSGLPGRCRRRRGDRSTSRPRSGDGRSECAVGWRQDYRAASAQAAPRTPGRRAVPANQPPRTRRPTWAVNRAPRSVPTTPPTPAGSTARSAGCKSIWPRTPRTPITTSTPTNVSGLLWRGSKPPILGTVKEAVHPIVG